MSQLKQYNSSTQQWEPIIAGAQGIQGTIGTTGAQGAAGGGGGGGTPGGSSGQVQFNQNGAFTGSADFTFGLPIDGYGVGIHNGFSINFWDSLDEDSVELRAPSNVTTSYILRLPPSQGANETYLRNDGSGNLTWKTPGILPQNSQSASYTLQLSDAGKHLLHPSTDTTARTWIIPQTGTGVGQVNWEIGTTLTFVNQDSAGVITIQTTNDTMRLAPTGTTGDRALAANGIATCIKITATEWIMSGVGIS